MNNIIPNWLAPNVITLAGFCCTLIPHLLIWSAFPGNLVGEIPPSLCYLAFVGLITYMILDNADGKQARKTKSSSPLGLLFDHGCDAMNTFIIGLMFFQMMQLGNSAISVDAYLITLFTFFAATWEEYYCEELVLPIFNGVNEGLVGIGFSFLLTAWFGSSFWANTIFGMKYSTFVVVGFAGIAVHTVYGNLQKIKEKAPNQVDDAISHLGMVSYIVITGLIVNYLSVTNVVERECRIFIYFIGLSFAKLVSILQASHTAHVPFDQYRLSIVIPCTVLNILVVFGYLRGEAVVNEDSLVILSALYALLAHAHFAFNIIEQFTRVLRIKVFKIKGPNDETSNLNQGIKGGKKAK